MNCLRRLKMKALNDNEYDFCQEFARTFDFSHSCIKSNVDRCSILIRLTDPKDNVNIFVRNAIDENVIANKFVDKEVITSGLVRIFMSGEDKHKLMAGKMLMDMVDNPDKANEFKNLIKAIKGV